MSHIVIIGFMGSGKTKVGKRIAKDLNLTFVDLDKRISDQVKMSTAEFFRKFEEPFYRAEETFMVKELLEEEQDLVISLGAAFPLQEQNEEYLRKLGTVVYLKATPSTILERLRAGSDNILTRGEVTEERIVRMLEMRDPIYQQFADVQVMTGVKSFEDLVQDIETKLSKFKPEKRVVQKVNYRSLYMGNEAQGTAQEDEKSEEAPARKPAHKAPEKKAASVAAAPDVAAAPERPKEAELEAAASEGTAAVETPAEAPAKTKPNRKRVPRPKEKDEAQDGALPVKEEGAAPEEAAAEEKPAKPKAARGGSKGTGRAKAKKEAEEAVPSETAAGEKPGQEPMPAAVDAGDGEAKPEEAPKKRKPATRKKTVKPKETEEGTDQEQVQTPDQEEPPKKKTRTSRSKKTAGAEGDQTVQES